MFDQPAMDALLTPNGVKEALRVQIVGIMQHVLNHFAQGRGLLPHHHCRLI